MENLIKALNLFQVNVYNKSTVEYSKVPKNIQGETSLEAFIHVIKDKLDQILL